MKSFLSRAVLITFGVYHYRDHPEIFALMCVLSHFVGAVRPPRGPMGMVGDVMADACGRIVVGALALSTHTPLERCLLLLMCMVDVCSPFLGLMVRVPVQYEENNAAIEVYHNNVFLRCVLRVPYEASMLCDCLLRHKASDMLPRQWLYIIFAAGVPFGFLHGCVMITQMVNSIVILQKTVAARPGNQNHKTA